MLDIAQGNPLIGIAVKQDLLYFASYLWALSEMAVQSILPRLAVLAPLTATQHNNYNSYKSSEHNHTHS